MCKDDICIEDLVDGKAMRSFSIDWCPEDNRVYFSGAFRGIRPIISSITRSAWADKYGEDLKEEVRAYAWRMFRHRMEVANIVYDVLMGNVGMSEHHVNFDSSKLSSPKVSADHGFICFNYDGVEYVITIDAVREVEND